MQNLLLLLAASLNKVNHLSPLSQKTFPIGNSGYSVNCITRRDQLPINQAVQSKSFFAGEWDEGALTYGLVLLQYPAMGVVPSDAALLLSSFTQRLQKAFGIAHTAQAEEWQSGDATEYSFIDYWQDGDGTDWKARGCSNGQTLALLFVKNIGAGCTVAQDYFLESFSFQKSNPAA